VKGGCKKEKFLVWFHQIFIHVKTAVTAQMLTKPQQNRRNPKKGNSDPNSKKWLARLTHKPP
jgi:hypothetical protein